MRSGKFSILAALLFAVPSAFGQAHDESVTENTRLSASFAKLDRFVASYDRKINDGKIGTLEFGIHAGAGWSFARFSRLDKNGIPQVTQDFWTTPDGSLYLRDQTELEVYKDAGKVWEKLRPIVAALLDRPASPQHCLPWGLISPIGPMIISSDSAGLDSAQWLAESNTILAKTESETLALHPVAGRMTIDRKNGLLKQQALENPAGVSLLILNNLQTELQPKDFARQFDLPLDQAEPIPYGQSLHGRNQILMLLEALIPQHENGKWKDPALLEDHLRLQEGQFARFLAESFPPEPLNPQNMFVQAVYQLVKHLSQRDHPLAIMQHPGFKKRMLEEEARRIRKALEDTSDAKFIEKFLGRPLKAKPGHEKRAEIVQNFFVRAYLRAGLEAATDHLYQKIKDNLRKQNKE